MFEEIVGGSQDGAYWPKCRGRTAFVTDGADSPAKTGHGTENSSRSYSRRHACLKRVRGREMCGYPARLAAGDSSVTRRARLLRSAAKARAVSTLARRAERSSWNEVLIASDTR